jgi:hypothetical protein
MSSVRLPIEELNIGDTIADGDRWVAVRKISVDLDACTAEVFVSDTFAAVLRLPLGTPVPCRRRPGRRSKPRAERSSAAEVRVNCRPGEREELQAAADAHTGGNLSRFVLEAALRSARRRRQ